MNPVKIEKLEPKNVYFLPLSILSILQSLHQIFINFKQIKDAKKEIYLSKYGFYAITHDDEWNCEHSCQERI